MTPNCYTAFTARAECIAKGGDLVSIQDKTERDNVAWEMCHRDIENKAITSRRRLAHSTGHIGGI